MRIILVTGLLFTLIGKFVFADESNECVATLPEVCANYNGELFKVPQRREDIYFYSFDNAVTFSDKLYLKNNDNTNLEFRKEFTCTNEAFVLNTRVNKIYSCKKPNLERVGVNEPHKICIQGDKFRKLAAFAAPCNISGVLVSQVVIENERATTKYSNSESLYLSELLSYCRSTYISNCVDIVEQKISKLEEKNKTMNSLLDLHDDNARDLTKKFNKHIHKDGKVIIPIQ